jgi:hypothetical protein
MQKLYEVTVKKSDISTNLNQVGNARIMRQCGSFV